MVFVLFQPRGVKLGLDRKELKIITILETERIFKNVPIVISFPFKYFARKAHEVEQSPHKEGSINPACLKSTENSIVQKRDDNNPFPRIVSYRYYRESLKGE